MPFNEVYITRVSSFFPNDPVSNDDMEEYLGYINKNPSKSKRIVLRNNGIKRRFYALTKDGKSTHTNAQITAEAVRGLFKDDPKKLSEIELLACGTSSPDQLMPSHAIMVHGELPETKNIEVVSAAGVCCAGMHALKYAFMAIKTGEVHQAVASGSERFSSLLRSEVFEDEVQKLIQLEANPYIGFEKEFLRWMLSDGASAVLLSDQKNAEGLSLRVDWIEGGSYANQMETCMYMGSEKMEDGRLKSYMEFPAEELISKSILSVKQDVKLLSESIVVLGGKKLQEVLQKKGMLVGEIDYFLPHMSSEFFKSKMYEQLKMNGMEIPAEKWFVNLSTVGNVGAGSVYMMVDELFHSGKLKKGNKLLLLVPESARFSYSFGLLTVC